mgnify:CR=1 FL=1
MAFYILSDLVEIIHNNPNASSFTNTYLALSMSTAFREEKPYKWLAFAAIAVGIAIRIGAYISNRTLILDEANVALNLHQRNYAELLKPLDYNQYAPPGFLWILKLSAQLLGYSEYAFRLFPLLCGVISIYLFYQLLLKLCSHAASIYPLWLMATGYIYLYYSSCIKQYSSDVLIVLVLLWLVLKTDLHTKKPLAFIAIWALAGGLLWFSMPVVFIFTCCLSDVVCRAVVK